MDEKKKLINWTAGISTVIVALLIIIVVMEPRGNGVSRAAASRAIALTLAGEDAVRAEGPETSFFPGELQDQWYVKYMDYLYAKGYLDPETVLPFGGKRRFGRYLWGAVRLGDRGQRGGGTLSCGICDRGSGEKGWKGRG